MVYSSRYYSLEKCPHCKKIIKLNSIRSFNFLKGSPIRTCPRCKETYVYPEYKEWGLVLFADKGDKFGILETIGLLMFHAALIFYLRSPAQYGYSPKQLLAVGIICILALASDYLLVQTIKNRIHREEYHQKQIDYMEGRTKERPLELVESMERLSNKEYLDALKEHRIDVPDYFYERLNCQQGGTE